MLPLILAIVAGLLGFYFLKRWQSDQSKTPSSNTQRLAGGQNAQPANNTNAKPAESTGPCVVKASEMKNGEVKEIKAGSETLLLIKDEGKFCAVGNKCNHAGVPLINGSYHNGTIRCPAHGACFSTATGDIEDCPGSLGMSIPVYDVEVKGDDVIVSGRKKERPAAKKSTKTKSNETFVILGGGAAGFAAAFALREFGFEGKIVLIGLEKHLPYDRTKLSKNLSIDVSKILLAKESDYEAARIDFRVAEVKEVCPDSREITLLFGEESLEKITYDKCLLATGSSPQQLRMIKGNEQPGKNVLFLRNVEDAHRIAKEVKSKSILILGSSFIGIETASCIVSSAAQVVVNGFEKVPFERVLGLEIGGLLQSMHENKKVQFKMNAGVVLFEKEDDIVHTVRFNDNTSWKGDVVIIGAGSVVNTAYLKPNGPVKFAQDKSIIVDRCMQAAPDLFAAGDIAKFPLPLLDNELVRIEHWGYAQTQGRCAARNMIDEGSAPLDSVPYFWTSAYGLKTVRYAGYGIGVDEILIDRLGEKEISREDPKFIAYYGRAGKLIAIACQSSKHEAVVARVAQLWKSEVYLQMDELRGAVKEGNSFEWVFERMFK